MEGSTSLKGSSKEGRVYLAQKQVEVHSVPEGKQGLQGGEEGHKHKSFSGGITRGKKRYFVFLRRRDGYHCRSVYNKRMGK